MWEMFTTLEVCVTAVRVYLGEPRASMTPRGEERKEKKKHHSKKKKNHKRRVKN